ncbi:membrane protease YdiL (CAAX protease family) [Nonomuraea endophytica]|uniref:Membrane protease YdiL (CAAX protease family) n=2 Tax=Nonomuraea endophytica TaxID=714136 RepID=A0A7W8EKA0_9ACTN|nr:membrane protease YdiL (CAAX protease family) [Nonomuraea endophytica]
MMALFLVVAFGLAWAFSLPLWLGGGLASPAFMISATALMFTPTLGVLAVWARTRTPFREWARENGLTFGPDRRRTLLLMAAAWIGTPLVVALCLALSAALGLVSLDLGGLSLFKQGMEAAGVPVPADVSGLVIAQIVFAVVATPLLNALPVLGEELGWRGWLLPRLVAARGVLGGLLLSGVIWGVWHFPITLLGYNYPALGPWAGPYFIVTCVLLGVTMGWLRLRTGSVWPAVVAHGAINGVTGTSLLLGDAAAPPNPAVVGVTGLVGWVVLALLGAALLKLYPVRPAEPATI